jgi:hypothetical protein
MITNSKRNRIFNLWEKETKGVDVLAIGVQRQLGEWKRNNEK